MYSIFFLPSHTLGEKGERAGAGGDKLAGFRLIYQRRRVSGDQRTKPPWDAVISLRPRRKTGGAGAGGDKLAGFRLVYQRNRVSGDQRTKPPWDAVVSLHPRRKTGGAGAGGDKLAGFRLVYQRNRVSGDQRTKPPWNAVISLRPGRKGVAACLLRRLTQGRWARQSRGCAGKRGCPRKF